MVEQLITLGKETVGQIAGWTWLILSLFALAPFFKKYFGSSPLNPKILLFIFGFIVPALDNILAFGGFSYQLLSSYWGIILVYLLFLILFKHQLAVWAVYGQLFFLFFQFIENYAVEFRTAIYSLVIFFLLVSVYKIIRQQKGEPFDYSTSAAAKKYETKRFQSGGENITQQECVILSDLIKECLPLNKVVDVGAGTGRISLFISQTFKPKELILVDGSDKMLAVAKDKLNDESVKYSVALAENLPLADNSIDLLVSYHLIKHLAEPEKFIREVGRVLSGRGLAVIEMTNKYSLVRLWSFRARLYGRKDFYQMCVKGGMKVKEYRGCNIFGETIIKFCPVILQKPLLAVDNFLSRLMPFWATKLIFSLTKN